MTSKYHVILNWIRRIFIAVILMLGLDAAPVELIRQARLGDRALAAGDPGLAIDYYNHVSVHAQSRPSVALKTAQARLALAQKTTGDKRLYHDALEAWFAAIPYHGFSLEIRRGLAETYLGLGQIQAAADQWAIVYAADPSDPSLWRQLAPALLAQGEWELAGRAFSELAMAEPAIAEYHYLAGLLNISADPIQASAHLLAARKDPAFISRAQILLSTAAELENLDDRTSAGLALGIALFQVGEPAMAERQFETVLESDPSLAKAWAYLGLAQFQQGKNSWPAFANALELAPSNSKIHGLAGHYWLQNKRPDLARPEFLEARRLDPEVGAFIIDIASTYVMEGDNGTAEAWYQEAIRLEPGNSTYWSILAWFYADTGYGKEDNALIAARRAVALAPEDSDALDALGWAQMMGGQTRLAETNLIAARQRDPLNGAIYFHLGKLYLETAQQDLARESFEQVLALEQFCRNCKNFSILYVELAQRELDQIGK
ncbi:MAG: tetratricopeptide repeat protein [Anaerolineales bacterium]|nr:tetratricopeptide repeat protein [Anaerolineales bacterium]